MSESFGLLDPSFGGSLGWALLHSLWQIAIVTGVYAAVVSCMGRGSANARYCLGCAALVAMLALPVGTLAWLVCDPQPGAPSVAGGAVRVRIRMADAPAPSADDLAANSQESARFDQQEQSLDALSGITHQTGIVLRQTWAHRVAPWLPWLSTGWLMGVLLFSLRPLLGLYTVRRVRTLGLSPLPDDVTRLADALVERLRVRRAVQFAQSTFVQVPTAIGYVRPMVLLPASVLTGLSTDQLELILAHELAHIRRRDYLVNLLQTGIETILFYHPGVWWVSAQVRNERENCCDDVALALQTRPHHYVHSLLALEEQRVATSLALAASGGSLVRRIRRLIAPPASGPRLERGNAWLAGLLPIIVLAGLLIAGSSLASSESAPQDTAEQDASATIVDLAATADVLPAEAATTPSEDKLDKAEQESVAQQTDDSAAAPNNVANDLAEDSNDWQLSVTLEDDARQPIKIALLDYYQHAVKTWADLSPGNLKLDLPALEAGRYFFNISSPGYATLHGAFSMPRNEAEPGLKPLKLYRARYLVLRYAANMRGERELTGPDVKEGRVAISYGNIADLRGDWMVRQTAATPALSLHRFQAGNGFYQPAGNPSFDEIKVAPEPDQYLAQSIDARKGAILLTHIIGDGPRGRRYAKLAIEDITEQPPQDIPVIDEQHPTKSFPVTPETKPARILKDRTNDPLSLTLAEEDGGQAPVKISLRDNLRNAIVTWENLKPGEARLPLPGLEHDLYHLEASAAGYGPAQRDIRVSETGLSPAEVSFKLFRQRYLVLRYVINTKGQRALTGPDCKEGRVAVLSGSIPDLSDWSVAQPEGMPKAVVHRFFDFSGFAPAAEGVNFDDLKLAPEPDAYDPTEIAFQKGMILFNRVLSHKPENMRYAKLLVEDITETRPKDIAIIEARAK